MILKVYDDEISCDYAEKGTDYIKTYQNGQLVREDSGISDFSGYDLSDDDGNSVEFTRPEPTIEERQAATERAVMEMAGEIYG